MPTLRRDIRHAIWREDAKAIASVAKTTLGTVVEYVPQAALISYSLVRLLEPIPIEKNPWDETKARILPITEPFAIILGLLYQGALGGLVGGIANAVGTLIAPLRFHLSEDKKTRRLDTLDALFVASYLPLILLTLRSQGVEGKPLL